MGTANCALLPTLSIVQLPWRGRKVTVPAEVTYRAKFATVPPPPFPQHLTPPALRVIRKVKVVPCSVIS